MRNKRLHPIRFFLHRYFYLGFAMLTIFVLVLPIQALVRLPSSLNGWNRLALQSGGTLADYAAEIRLFLSSSLLYSLLGLEGLCILFAVTGFLSAMILFRHLFSRRRGMLVDSLPNTRAQDFGRRFLCFLLFSVLPILLSCGAYFLVVALNGLRAYLVWEKLLARMAVLLLIHFYGFAVGTLACVLTGYFWAALLAGAVLTVSFEGTFLLWSTIAQRYLGTMPDNFYHIWLGRLSPIYVLYKNVYRPGAVSLLPGFVCILGMGGLALLLYRLRPLESAEHTLAFHPLEWIMELFLGLVGGTLTGALVWYTAGTELSLLLGLFLGTLLISGLCYLVFHLRLTGIFQRWYLPVCTSVALLLAVVCLHYDVLGYDHWLPSREDLTAFTFYPFSRASEAVTLTSPEALDAAYEWASLLRDEADDQADGMQYPYRSLENVCVTYQLGGRKVSRLYENKTTRSRSAELMKYLLESDDYRAQQTGRFFFRHPEKVQTVNIYPEMSYYSHSSYARCSADSSDPSCSFTISDVLDALRQDLAARTYEDLLSQPLFTLELYGQDEEGQSSALSLWLYAADDHVLSVVFGSAKADVVDFVSGGYAAMDGVIAVKQVYSVPASALYASERSLHPECLLDTQAAASPEQAVEWARQTVVTESAYRYYAPDFRPDSYSVLYLFRRDDLEDYVSSGALAYDPQHPETLPGAGNFWFQCRYFPGE